MTAAVAKTRKSRKSNETVIAEGGIGTVIRRARPKKVSEELQTQAGDDAGAPSDDAEQQPEPPKTVDQMANASASTNLQQRGPADPPEPQAAPKTSAKVTSKAAKVVEMLKADGGVTVSEIMAATNWQAHSVRGFLSGTVKKKQGLAIEKGRAADGALTYRIVSSQIDAQQPFAPNAEYGEGETNQADDIGALAEKSTEATFTTEA